MAWTMSDYESLKQAIATGAREVQFKDKRVAYRSLSQMQSILTAMAAELGIVDPNRRPKVRAARFRNGL